MLVFTNGCFDILHAGHIRLLKYAKSLGDHLIVGLNSDTSVRRLKGPSRPVFSVETRYAILSELRCVNEVRIFHTDTPEDLITELRPDILVKGPASLNTHIPGADLIVSRGGRIIVPDWPIDESTTNTIYRILERNQEC